MSSWTADNQPPPTPPPPSPPWAQYISSNKRDAEDCKVCGRRIRFMRLIVVGLAVIMLVRMSDDTSVVVVRLKYKIPDGLMKSLVDCLLLTVSTLLSTNDAVRAHNYYVKYI